MQIIKKFFDNSLFFITLFLLAFIPLYPKLPLLDIKNTWVYVRVEDFLVLAVLSVWTVLLLRKKVSLKTPLTFQIFTFWLIGALATLHGVLIIFPTLANIFPNVAFLSYIRHIEYISLFFVAYSAIKSKKSINLVIFTVVITFILVCLYGLGQRYAGFPAYLTMNEEFAKGTPITLSQLSRIPSTFAGHYDFAAYLVLMIPIIASLVFGFKNIFVKAFMVAAVGLGAVLLFMTVSRVSFFVLFISLFFVLFFQKKKLALFMIPIVLVLGIIFIGLQPTLLSRFGSTVKETEVLVDAKTGTSLGHVEFVSRNYLADKLLVLGQKGDGDDSAFLLTDKDATSAGILRRGIRVYYPKQIPLVKAINVSTGESLPQGSGYINLALSPVSDRVGSYYYELPSSEGTAAATVKIVQGEYLIKKAAAYDLSFTTRFQGEWPHALEAFKRNLFFGSGYGSVSLAVDNNYLRILGEIGLFGFVSFFALFISLGIFIRKTLPKVDSRLTKSFILGFSAGVIGLSLNAVLIDVFEASKIAFQLWLMVGVVVGILSLYHERVVDLNREILKAAASKYAIIAYLAIGVFVIFTTILGNYFTGDDFTWFRWAAECRDLMGKSIQCSSYQARILNYFINSDGFFYRPGTKVYFLLMYSVLWLNPVAYHLVSIVSHAVVVILLFLVSLKILKDKILSTVAAFLYLISSSYIEQVVWASSTGHIFTAIFILLSLLFYVEWIDKKKIVFVALSFVSICLGLLFHEQGVVAPVLLVAYAYFRSDSQHPKSIFRIVGKWTNTILFLPVVGYLILRYMSGSHWFNGDYSYNIVKLPFNVGGNLMGYSLIGLFGNVTMPLYEAMRTISRQNIAFTIPTLIVIIGLGYIVLRFILRNCDQKEKRIITFAVLFFGITLLPFLGLGNITSRYSYLPTFGIIILATLFIKRLYDYLLYNGRQITLLILSVLFSVYSLFHIIQAQQALADWHGAGVIVKNFLQSIDEVYQEDWQNHQVNLHFTNVPIKNGEAWVFPVGLPDAVWFAFKNENINTYIDTDSATAIKQIPYNMPYTFVLEFQSDGTLKEIVRKSKTLNSQ